MVIKNSVLAMNYFVNISLPIAPNTISRDLSVQPGCPDSNINCLTFPPIYLVDISLLIPCQKQGTSLTPGLLELSENWD